MHISFSVAVVFVAVVVASLFFLQCYLQQINVSILLFAVFVVFVIVAGFQCYLCSC